MKCVDSTEESKSIQNGSIVGKKLWKSLSCGKTIAFLKKGFWRTIEKIDKYLDYIKANFSYSICLYEWKLPDDKKFLSSRTNIPCATFSAMLNEDFVFKFCSWDSAKSSIKQFILFFRKHS